MKPTFEPRREFDEKMEEDDDGHIGTHCICRYIFFRSARLELDSPASHVETHMSGHRLGRTTRPPDADTTSAGIQLPTRRQITNEEPRETMVARRQRFARTQKYPNQRRYWSRPTKFAQLEFAEEQHQRSLLSISIHKCPPAGSFRTHQRKIS